MNKNGRMITFKTTFKWVALVFAAWIIGYGLFILAVLNAVPQSPHEKTEAIVALTGGELRIENALQLYANGLAPELFITGVYQGVKIEDIKNKWQNNQPLPECCITLGHKATTTYQNAQETLDWLKTRDIHSIRLVTANYHMNRALIEFQKRLPANTKILIHPITQPDAVPSKLWFWLITMSEYNKNLIRLADFLITVPEAAKTHGKHEDH
jgi:uncharacterized SAM-binding protein YcdF (DUF218 family)